MGTQVETQTPQKTKSPAQIFSDPFERFHDEMDRLFSSYFRHLPWTKLGFGTEGGSLLANLDVSETPETVQVVLDVPGIKEKDIDVTLNDSSLTIKGKRESEVEEKKKNYHRIERSHGAKITSLGGLARRRGRTYPYMTQVTGKPMPCPLRPSRSAAWPT